MQNSAFEVSKQLKQSIYEMFQTNFTPDYGYFNVKPGDPTVRYGGWSRSGFNWENAELSWGCPYTFTMYPEEDRGKPVTRDYGFGVVYFHEAPMNNCGAMMMTAPGCSVAECSSTWLTIIEAYCRWRKRGLLFCSDRAGGPVDTFISQFGKNWNSSSPVWNVNYREDHVIRLWWKDVSRVDSSPYFPPRP